MQKYVLTVDFANKQSRYYGLNSEGIFCDSGNKKTLIKALLCRQLACAFFLSQDNKWRSAPWAKIYKRRFIKENMIRFDTSLHPYEDTLFNSIVIHEANNICIINQNIYNYRVNNNGVLRSCSYNAVENDLHYLEAISDLLGKFEWEDSAEIIDMLSVMLINDVLMRYYCHPQNKESKKETLRKMNRLVNDENIK